MPPLNESPSTPRPAGPEYWRSLDHLAGTPEFREFMFREFPAGASEMLDSADRRQFLKIMSASMALAGLGVAGCRRWPEEHIVPYAHRPEGRDPGVPAHYATCLELSGVASGVIVTSFDGRPIKIEGNPDHPTSRGAADHFAQASVLDLYDPDRSRGIRHEGEPAAWVDFLTWAEDYFKKAKDKRGHGLAVLSEASSSPSVEALRRRFLSVFPNATWHEYEPLNNDAVMAGATMAFGMPYRTHLDLPKAAAVVSFDADFLGAPPNAVAHIRGFAAGRRTADEGSMSRLHVFESGYSLTGANADERTAMRSADVPVAVAYAAARILGDQAAKRLENDPAAAAVLTPAVRAALDRAVEDLEAHRGSSTRPGTALVTAGPRQPAEVHLLVHLMNDALGAAGSTVAYSPQREQVRHVESLEALMASKVETLVVLGGNPVYDAPADLDFAVWLEGVKASVHLSDEADETSMRCTWHVNRAHPLESWGDGRAWDGSFSVRQPLVEPFFQGRSEIELLALITADDLRDGRQIVRQTFAEMVGGEDEVLWTSTLHDGVFPKPGNTYPLERPPVRRDGLAAAVETLAARWAASREGWEAVFAPHPTLYDGRFANNGWLQELPDPITKLTWDNAVIMGPAAAASLGVETGDMVRLGVQGGPGTGTTGTTVDGAVLVQPGWADRSVTLHLGGGRGFDGRICAGAGFDFQRLRTADAMGVLTGLTVTPIGGSYTLATTQDHHTIDVDSVGGRGVQERLPWLFREATLEEYRQEPDFAAHRVHVVHRLSLWEESNLEGAEYKWGMSVDLNSCVGCGACIVACQAENNIPIVGKEMVHRGREMQWIRVDRYFAFGRRDGRYDPDDVRKVALQPVLCMQCENAPCEQVCPVAATVHDKDGLNVMVYNRCVGTRYCSNNCPYKVRRFNYFDYHRRQPVREGHGLLDVQPSYYEKHSATPDELRRLQFNPEVTVRMRGVMEKCTYCIQRISAAKIQTKNDYVRLPEEEKQRRRNERIAIPDGTITPACAQTCPAEALVFGDLNDPKSRVSRLQANPRSYQMLEELNVDARTKYLAKLRNPSGGGLEGGKAGGQRSGEGHADS